MESYSPLLERTRVPQPSLQSFAVISIFDKLRSAPPHLGVNSDPGRDAITQCLNSTSPAVVDQSVRELCRLVKDSKLELSRGLLELQSALEGSDSRFVDVFVKGLGLLVRLGFQKDSSLFRFHSSENHPFIKILSCRTEVQSELLQQVLLFMAQNQQFGMLEICDFLRPFLNSLILRMPSSASLSSFARNLIPSMASVSCSYPLEAMPVFKLLTGCLKYFPCKNAEDITNISYFVGYMVDAYIVVLRHLVGMGMLVHEAQLCGVEMLETYFSLCTQLHKRSGGGEAVIEVSRHLLVAQKELGLSYIPELSSVILSLFISLIQSDLEHEQLSILKLLFFLLKWKGGCEFVGARNQCGVNEELLFVFPVMTLVSSPSRSVKQVAIDLLSMLEKLSVNLLITPKEELKMQQGFPAISRPEYIVFRLLQKLWFEDQPLSFCSSHLNFTSIGEANFKESYNVLKTRISLVREFSLSVVEKRRSSLPTSHSQEIFLNEMPPILGALASVLVIHHTLGSSAVDLLAVTGNMDPKLGVPLLLVILFYNNIFSGKDEVNDSHSTLLKLLGMLPSLASHPAMMPLVVQTILPMLHNDTPPYVLDSSDYLALLFCMSDKEATEDELWSRVKALASLWAFLSNAFGAYSITEISRDWAAVLGYVLYSTAIRLLCKTWEINDRVFGSFEGVLLPKGFTEVTSERTISISMAVSIRDVCKRNPDRGVDLILSVSACIENKDPIIQALGFQSLAHLCEADVLDFYTAWAVIAKHVSSYSTNAVVAHRHSKATRKDLLSYYTCLLLRWGAMDAEAYPEAAIIVPQILWEIGTSKHPGYGSIWAKPRAAAFEALTHYDVLHIQKSIPDFKERNVGLLTSENDLGVLRAMEGFEVKILTYEHITRRRLVKEKRNAGNKIEKLLNVFPQVIFASGSSNGVRELPGAALFCISFTPKDVNNQGATKGSQDLHARYENALVEIAASLQLSRNILMALLSLQSWKPFMQRWMRACIMLLDAKAPTTVLDKTSKVANDILKSMRRIAEESIPRSAENIALAVGALCMVMPPSAHAIKSSASKFLLNWLFQYEHEHRQWSAAISLGVISSCLHVTDHKQKFQNINALLEVASFSKSTLVKGACGVGLGLSCQDLLTRVQVEDNSHLDKETYKTQEIDLLRKIVRGLCHMLCQFTQSSYDTLESLSDCFPLGTNDADSYITPKPFSLMTGDDLEEDIWGVAGLVLGLGSSVSAIYRAGAHDAVFRIKDLIISWIPHVNPSIQNSAMSEKREIVLSVGSCLALPIIVAFCQRVELINDAEVDHIVSGCRELISELVSSKKSGILHQSLLLASCIGAGNLLACILNEGVYSVELEHVKDILDLFRKTYSNPHPPLIHLGGMLGVVNALGAGAGTLPVMEPDLTLLIQEIFLVAKDPDDQQLQQYAAWAVSFLRHYLTFREARNEDSNFPNDASGPKSISQSFPEDSLVMKLCLWLMHLNYHGSQSSRHGTKLQSEWVSLVVMVHLDREVLDLSLIESGKGTISHVNTVTTVLRCLSHAPRLPILDWGAIIRRCMRYEGQVASFLASDSALKKGILREECLFFSLAHASQFDSLLSFLDELSELSRFRTLELNLQSCILFHLADLIKIFSGSRLEKVFDDVANFVYGLVSSDQLYNPEEKSLLRVSCWKGLYSCLDETSLDSQEYMSNVKNCMETLFSLLPEDLYSEANIVGEQGYLLKEWSEAVGCLGKAPREWLMNLLQVLEMDFSQGDVHLCEVKKKIKAKARLVRIGSLPMAELGKLKGYILNTSSEAIWDILVEIAATLQHADGSVKRQWIVDAVEISCVTSYPSTAMQFLGLLCGIFSKYMPLLIVDRFTVLSDLPVTLTSLLSETSWGEVAESVVLYLWASMVRIHDWVTRADDDSQPAAKSHQSIDKSEEEMALFLLKVMHHTCVPLKDYLPLDKQLRLANMVFPL
ncbi:hypothetical protein LguiB_008764 [Lonicera macranthoides]